MTKFKFSRNGVIATLAIASVVGITGLVMAQTAPSLGTADSFAVLAGSGITASNPSTVSGDVGTYPTTTEVGTITVTGTNHAGDATTQSAKTALTNAYLDAQGQTLPSVTALVDITTDSFSGTGHTLAPGIYKSANQIGVTGTLTLNGTASDIWIFQAPSTLTTASSAVIAFSGGAQACNVFWQVGSSATIGTGTHFKGSILALTDITDNGGSTIEGRLLARNGHVTLDNTAVVNSTCVSVPSTGSYGTTGIQKLPLINVTKVPTPAALPLGPGSVTYNYTTTNIGETPIINMWIKDDKCSNVNYVSGDTNNNGALDLTETWLYSCTKVVSQTETNTVTAYGKSAEGWETYDTANATVVVSLPIVAPLIHLVKTPNIFVLPAGGGQVIYTYTITNPGTVPLNNVSITDDKCTGLPTRIASHPGDLNKNGLLDTNETFHFTCVSNITKTTTNTGTAEGEANGLTAIDFAKATVAVTPPKLPNTGYGPEDKSNTLLNILVPAGIAGLLLSLYIARRKRTV